MSSDVLRHIRDNASVGEWGGELKEAGWKHG